MAARPERVPAEEVRQRMLDAGRELALEAGAALTIEHLRLEEVIQRARVPRSSVYRLWPYRDEYIDDLLCYLAGAGSAFSDRTGLHPETFTATKRMLDDNRALLATPDGRRAIMREVVRITTTANYQALTDPRRGGCTSRSSPPSVDPHRPGAQADRGHARGGAARSRESLVAVFELRGGRDRPAAADPAWSVSHLQLAGGLLVQSLALRNLQVPSTGCGPTARTTSTTCSLPGRRGKLVQRPDRPRPGNI